MAPAAAHSRVAVYSALLVAVGLALPLAAARADSIAVVFDGPISGGQHFGLSADGAAAAQSAGVALLDAPLQSARNRLQIVAQELETLNLTPGDLVPPFEVRSGWTARNVSGSALGDIVYLVFTTADSREVLLSTGAVTADYDETRVGLRIDSADGWVLFQATDALLGTLYYPARRLGSLPTDAQAEVDVNYYLGQLLTYPDGSVTRVPLPRLRIAMAVIPIPEPQSALVLAVGLALLGAITRARS